MRILGIWILMVLSVLATACSFSDEPPLCPYNARLDYWYSGGGDENELLLRVDHLTQYLYDSHGELLRVEELRGDSVLHWRADLPPGDYSVVTWGNLGTGAEASVVEEGPTALKDMTLSAARPDVPPGYRSNTERLYYATKAFTVEAGKVCRERVYVSHAHARLNITVRWLADFPGEGGVYRMRMRGVPAKYGFIREREIESSSGSVHSVPWISSEQTWHEAKAAMNYEDEVQGELITYRFENSTHELWSLWRDGERIIKELDLQRFFDTLPMSLDENVEQEFDLIITVWEDKITVALASSVDWVEGGAIG